MIDISDKYVLSNYLKVRNELSKYDKNILKKKEVIFFNKTDLINKETIDKKIKIFRKKIKKDFQMISLVTNENLEKAKKVIYKKCI